jgi:hypothetical protein
MVVNLYFDKDGAPMSRRLWAKRFEDMAYRRIGLENVGKYEVSTVWLGVNHNFAAELPPLIFETMVFDVSGDRRFKDLYCERYSTEDQALAGHQAVVKALKDGITPDQIDRLLSGLEDSGEP